MQVVVDPAPSSVPKRIVAIAAGCLVVLGVFMAVSGDFSSSSSAYTAPSTDLAAATTDLAMIAGLDGIPLPTAKQCANVKDWNLFNSIVTQNNLGGVGPNTADKQEIRFSSVSDLIDLVITIDKAHQAEPYVTSWNGRWNGNVFNKIQDSGKFGMVNVRGGTSVAMKFTLVDAGTDTPVEIAPDQTVFFSVFDMDAPAGGGYEYVKFTTPVDSYMTTTSTTVKTTGDKNNLLFKSGRLGIGADKVTDPLTMTQLQKDSAAWITYKGRNTWSITFGAPGVSGNSGRNMYFAGRAEGDCPPGNLEPAPGGCTAGIEGMIKGGGRVCCPDECGQQEGPGAKWAEAPNQCGGPGCDKGPDGKRNAYRYKNCCVGKPISGGTARETITAPYGITAQGRFCTGLGSDAPPCINKLSKLSDRI